MHALKIQSVAIPNGLIANLYGQVKGRRHDAGMLKDSSLLNVLQREAHTPRGDPLCLCGDPAYHLRPQLMSPFREAAVPVLTLDMMAFNTAMSEVRLTVSVERLFDDLAEYSKFIDFKNNLKLGMSALGKQYIVSALYRNILYGNSTSELFQLEHPTLLEYLA